MTIFKLLPGLGMTVVLLWIAGARLGSLNRVSASTQPVRPGRVARTADIARAVGINLSRTDEALALSPDLADASSSGATTAPMSEQ